MIVPELAIPGIIEEVKMSKKTGGSHVELYKTERKDTTHGRNNIFVGKDIEDRKKTSCDSPKMDVPMQQQTRRMDCDVPAITLSEIDTASLSRLSFRRPLSSARKLLGRSRQGRENTFIIH